MYQAYFTHRNRSWFSKKYETEKQAIARGKRVGLAFTIYKEKTPIGYFCKETGLIKF